jgi:hypothetical protein
MCHRCNREANKGKSNRSAIDNNQESTQIPKATFMENNPRSRCRLPFGLGQHVTAFFTHRSAVDMPVIDMMRALFNMGVRPESFAEMLLELHSKKYIDDYLKREFAIEQRSSEAVLVLRRRRCSLHLRTRCATLVLCQPESLWPTFTRSTARRSRPIWRKKSRSIHRLDFISMLRTRKQSTLHVVSWKCLIVQVANHSYKLVWSTSRTGCH